MKTILLLFSLMQEAGPSLEQTSQPSSDWTIILVIALATLLLAIGIPLFVWLLKRNATSGNRQADYNLYSSPIPENKPAPVLPPDRNTRPDAPPSQRPQAQALKLSSATPAIFVSYRRDDSGDVTGRIYDRLTQHFGKEAVFKDVDSIPLGVDYRKHLGDSVGQCDVLLAVLGRQWLAGTPGQRRIDDVRDFVRIEIEAALQRDIPVVPVLVQGATVPELQALPETLQSLVYRNGIPVRPDPDFHGDMDKLIRGIEGYLKKQNQ